MSDNFNNIFNDIEDDLKMEHNVDETSYTHRINFILETRKKSGYISYLNIQKSVNFFEMFMDSLSSINDYSSFYLLNNSLEQEELTKNGYSVKDKYGSHRDTLSIVFDVHMEMNKEHMYRLVKNLQKLRKMDNNEFVLSRVVFCDYEKDKNYYVKVLRNEYVTFYVYCDNKNDSMIDDLMNLSELFHIDGNDVLELFGNPHINGERDTLDGTQVKHLPEYDRRFKLSDYNVTGKFNPDKSKLANGIGVYTFYNSRMRFIKNILIDKLVDNHIVFDTEHDMMFCVRYNPDHPGHYNIQFTIKELFKSKEGTFVQINVLYSVMDYDDFENKIYSIMESFGYSRDEVKDLPDKIKNII